MNWRRAGDNLPNYYEILGLARNASETDIKLRFRELARATHPDVGGSEEHFKAVSEAHDVLTTERQDYDAAWDLKFKFGKSSASLAGVSSAIPEEILDTQTLHHWVTIRRDPVMLMVAADRIATKNRDISPADALLQAFDQLRPYINPTALAWAVNDVSDSSPELGESSIDRLRRIGDTLTRDNLRQPIAKQAQFMRQQAAEYRRNAQAAVDVFQVAIDIVGPPPTRPLEVFREHPFSDEFGKQNISIGLLFHASSEMAQRLGMDASSLNNVVSDAYLRAVTYPDPPGMEQTNIEALLRAGGTENYRAAVEILRTAQQWAASEIPKLAILETWNPLSMNLIGRTSRAMIRRGLLGGKKVSNPQLPKPPGQQKALNL
jgi:curved DNA-binding protein CbpA